MIVSNPRLQHALAYAELGFRVLPVHTIRNGVCSCRKGKSCKHPGKHPRTKHGVKDATTDPEKIKRWWTQNADSNVGIATGAGSEIVVLDIDPRNNGSESLAKLVDRLGPFPPTVESLTGGGGGHLIFCHPGGHVGNSQSAEPGIDIKADGGLIVVPPSIHVSGGRYLWLSSFDPWSIRPAALPEEWLRWLQSITRSCNRAIGCNQSNPMQLCGVGGGASESESETKTDTGYSTLSTEIDAEAIDRCIRETLPTGPGQRNQAIMRFCRALKSIADFANAQPKDLRVYVRRWYEQALPFIRTTEFETTYFDFAYAWGRVKFAKGDVPMAQIVARALAADYPDETAHYENDGIRKLAAVCRELQRAMGDGAFFLSARTAADYLKIDPVTAWRWLRILEMDGILKVVTRGSNRDRKASRLRYLAEL